MKLPEHLDRVSKAVRVLRDRVLVQQLPYIHPTLATPGMTINKGVVVAVGYGRRRRRLTGFQQHMEGAGVAGSARSQYSNSGRTIYFEDGAETGHITPMQVAIGDVVEYGPRNNFEVDFDRVGFAGVGKLTFVWQGNIYAIDPTGSHSDSLLWQKSAGYDKDGKFMSGSEAWHRA